MLKRPERFLVYGISLGDIISPYITGDYNAACDYFVHLVQYMNKGDNSLINVHFVDYSRTLEQIACYEYGKEEVEVLI